MFKFLLGVAVGIFVVFSGIYDPGRSQFALSSRCEYYGFSGMDHAVCVDYLLKEDIPGLQEFHKKVYGK